ncbi:putative leucine-rich repeat-containing protein DDB_G0290503 [Daktulosphaira vitifoliae]|uniref:putative leucine-rich repeat-containing protein DDB_G0290503 n=1 Tax=Daktulosphaira vitifoliae TaxID=58002 RepID=UPI0021AA77C4|nr:putative leucine-rich repeat-containing protein DDB_G0290503 [Daktulosphaira vitifoliae]
MLEKLKIETQHILQCKTDELHKLKQYAADSAMEILFDTNKFDELSREVKDLEQDICEARSLNQKRVSELFAFKALETERLEKSEKHVNAVHKDVFEITDTITKNAKKIQELNNYYRQLELSYLKERNSSQEIIEKLDTDFKKLSKDLSLSSKLLTIAQLNSNSLANEKDSMSKNIGKLTGEINRLEEKLRDGRAKLSIEQAKYDTLSMVMATQLSTTERKVVETSSELNELKQLKNKYELTINKLIEVKNNSTLINS